MKSIWDFKYEKDYLIYLRTYFAGMAIVDENNISLRQAEAIMGEPKPDFGG